MGPGGCFRRGPGRLKLGLVHGGQHDEILLQDDIGGAAVAVSLQWISFGRERKNFR